MTNLERAKPVAKQLRYQARWAGKPEWMTNRQWREVRDQQQDVLSPQREEADHEF